MKQVLQSLRDGRTEVADVPAPVARPGHVVIRTHRTLVSAGTERMLVEFAKAGWIGKARRQPEKVRAVIDKVRVDGLSATLESVLNKLDQPLALGYCNVGTVVEADATRGLHPGDRVVSNGRHAEVVCVPVTLCAKVPAGVTDDTAVFTVLGAIALQGIRLVAPTIGECVVVTGLGLIGLLAVQLLVANGCRVLGLDFDERRLALAAAFGAETVSLAAGGDPLRAAAEFSRGRGVDAVLITASTTDNGPLEQAAAMCRKRGRIVLVGQTGMQLSRQAFYEKELTFQVSCSYGPGRYDPTYETQAIDYPVGYVRWTEQRNFEAVLDAMAAGRIVTAPLISHRFPVERAADAYAVVSDPAAGSLGVVLDYPAPAEAAASRALGRSVPTAGAAAAIRPGAVCVGFIGGGNYATGILMPAFRAAGARLKTVASRDGVSGVYAARKHGFEATTTDVDALLDDAAIDAVVVATRHDSHAALAARALAAGKHVFVEKPLAIDDAGVTRVLEAHRAARDAGRPLVLGIGFNRRFAPLTRRISQLLGPLPGPKAFVMTVNAGAVPAGHWTQDPAEGGGRIVGECCHFVDLLRALAGEPIVGHVATFLPAATRDTLTLTLSFADGSLGTVHYLANGNRAFPKERLEVFASGRVLVLDNFRGLTGYGWRGFRRQRLWRQDKGQRDCVAAFLAAVAGRADGHVPVDQIEEVARLCIAVAGGSAGTAGARAE